MEFLCDSMAGPARVARSSGWLRAGMASLDGEKVTHLALAMNSVSMLPHHLDRTTRIGAGGTMPPWTVFPGPRLRTATESRGSGPEKAPLPRESAQPVRYARQAWNHRQAAIGRGRHSISRQRARHVAPSSSRRLCHHVFPISCRSRRSYLPIMSAAPSLRESTRASGAQGCPIPIRSKRSGHHFRESACRQAGVGHADQIGRSSTSECPDPQPRDQFPMVPP
jgi:hypothetical protein